MSRVVALALVLVASAAQAYDSRCYIGGVLPCHDGPQSARNRWIGLSDEHRQLWVATVARAGVPAALALADFTLDVFAADDIVPEGTGQSIPTLTPVAFDDAERTHSRTMSAAEFAQLPDFGFSLWDWATGFETCPLDPSLPGPAPLDACHEFKTHMGAVNSNHFLPQAQAFYAYYHQLALGRAAACKTMADRITARGGQPSTFQSFLDACGQEAFVLEAIAHHFLQDAWSTGHMWERWGSPDLIDFTDLPQSLLIAMTSGLIHGARGVLQDAIGFAGFDVNDPLCAPGADVRFIPGPITSSVVGLGDLYLGQLLAQDGDAFPAQYFQLFSCAATSMRQVYRAMGEDPGQLDPALIEVDDPAGPACFAQRVTNAAMSAGIGLDMTTPVGTTVRIELDSLTATQLVPLASAFIGGDPQNVNPILVANYLFDISAIVTHARLQAAVQPNATDVASGGLPPLLHIDRNSAYVQQPLAPYVDPPLPWPDPPTGANDAATRALALARTFHAAHATEWCNRFRAGASDGTDLEALRSHVHVLQDSGIGGEDLEAACIACETFVSRSLRVGADESDYDHDREPLCHFIADDEGAVQYVFQPGDASDGVGTIAKRYCGCTSPVTVTLDPAADTVAPSDSFEFNAFVVGATDRRVQWRVVSGDGTITPDTQATASAFFVAGNSPGTITVRATSVADPSAFGEATITVASALASVEIRSGRTPGLLEAFLVAVGGSQADRAVTKITSPIGDVGGFEAKVRAALAGVTDIDGALVVTLDAPESVALHLDRAIAVRQLVVRGNGCSSSVTLSVGDVRSSPRFPGPSTHVFAGGGCLSHIAITVGDVENDATVDNVHDSQIALTTGTIGRALFLGCLGFQCLPLRSTTVEVHAASIPYLEIANSSDSTMTLQGQGTIQGGMPPGVDIKGNTNLTLGAPITYGNVDYVSLTDNSFASPPTLTIGNELVARDLNTTNLGLVSIERNSGLSLGGITLGSIAGDLTIADNHGFSNGDALSFANALSVAGTLSISGNTP